MLALLTLTLCLQPPAAAPQEPAASRPAAAVDTSDAAVRAAIARGVAFLVSAQNADGSWGGTTNKTMTDSFANAATHEAWTFATTGLCCSALLAHGGTPAAEAACDRAVDYLCARAELKRPADWDTDNTWGFVYGLNGVAEALVHARYKGSAREAPLRKAGDTLLAKLQKYQSDKGGWAYYADPAGAWLTGMETSFTTAVGVLAIVRARDAGLAVDSRMLARAVAAVEHCRLPNGAFTYGIDTISEVGRFESINNVKGSLGRIQVCNLALLEAGGKVTPEQIRWGIEQFFTHHRFLAVGRQKPIPHESWYAVAGYFYFFGHCYAGQLLAKLPKAERQRWVEPLRLHVLETIEKDGSMWDFWISANTRPYGTAFGVLALGATLEPAATGAGR
jgi:hypothetical protein